MKKKLIIGLLSLSMLVFVVTPVFAESPLSDKIDAGLSNAAAAVGWEESSDLETIILNIINVIMAFLGLIAIIIVLWGGFIWMTSGGNEDKVSTAKKLIVSGAIGLAIIIGAYAISSWVVHTLVNVAGQEAVGEEVP